MEKKKLGLNDALNHNTASAAGSDLLWLARDKDGGKNMVRRAFHSLQLGRLATFGALLTLPNFVTAEETISGEGVNDAMASSLGDVVPLLQLFGEHPTKAYIAHGRGYRDALIQGVWPIGLLTMASALIRLSGSKVARSMLGRIAERDDEKIAELLTTSTDHHSMTLDANSAVSKRLTSLEKDLIFKIEPTTGNFGLSKIYEWESADPHNAIGLYSPAISSTAATAVVVVALAAQYIGLWRLDELTWWASTPLILSLFTFAAGILIDQATPDTNLFSANSGDLVLHWAAGDQTLTCMRATKNAQISEEKYVDKERYLSDMVAVLSIAAYICQYLWLRTLSWAASLVVLGAAVTCIGIRFMRLLWRKEADILEQMQEVHRDDASKYAMLMAYTASNGSLPMFNFTTIEGKALIRRGLNDLPDQVVKELMSFFGLNHENVEIAMRMTLRAPGAPVLHEWRTIVFKGRCFFLRYGHVLIEDNEKQSYTNIFASVDFTTKFAEEAYVRGYRLKIVRLDGLPELQRMVISDGGPGIDYALQQYARNHLGAEGMVTWQELRTLKEPSQHIDLVPCVVGADDKHLVGVADCSSAVNGINGRIDRYYYALTTDIRHDYFKVQFDGGSKTFLLEVTGFVPAQ